MSKKRVQVVLNQDVRKLGNNGDLVEVAPGYARNYLIPQNKAVFATPGVLKQVERRRQAEQRRLEEQRQAAIAFKDSLETIHRFRIERQVGEGESIFGTVTNQDVAEAIQEQTGKEVDRRGISLPDEINKTGFYKAHVKLDSDITAEIEIQVVPS
jgi:large subunit ribosomal protein L9